MNQQDCFFLGFVTKSFGYKGELVLFLDVDEPQFYSKLDSVFIEIKGQLIPFFIEKISLVKGQNVTVRFQDVSVEESLALIGNKLFLPLTALPKLKGNKFYFHEVLGFKIKDIEKGPIGILDQINDSGPQAIFVIHNEDKEIMMPVIDKFIVKVDRDAKEITVKAPEGLIDFYLNL
ncbi:MAG: ribosome maturation factor RimM [Bacteroidales bacterium]